MLDFECKNLQKVPLFKDIDARSLQLIAFAANRMTFQPGEVVMERGHGGEAMFIVVSGEVDSYIQRPDGEEMHLSRFGPGRSFGEISVLNETDTHISMRAFSQAMLLQISRTDFLELTREIPQFALAVMRDLARRLNIMIQKYAEHPAA